MLPCIFFVFCLGLTADLRHMIIEARCGSAAKLAYLRLFSGP